MMKRSVIFVVVVLAATAFMAVQTQSQTGTNRRSDLPGMQRLQKMSEEDSQRFVARRRPQRRSELEQMQKESARTDRQLKREQLERKKKLRQLRERSTESKRELLHEKYALKATEEQWKVIKHKLEKVRLLRDQARSTVGLLLGSSISLEPVGTNKAIVPAMQWNPRWKDKTASELTEPQKIANRLMSLLDKDKTADEQFIHQIIALRQAREKQKRLEEELANAREDLRKGLTTRQEAVLILMGWL